MIRYACIAFFATCFLLQFQACKNDTIRPTVSFYYWKTTFRLSNIEKEALRYNRVTRLYLRYFDINLNENKEAIPLSPISFGEKPGNIEIVPVVYIKNEIWEGGLNDPTKLAEKVYKYIGQINKNAQINIREIQIDCDWTLKSRDSFMKFIHELKIISDKTISATIRLHQIKYPKKTGIPEVTSATLMYYNMGNISGDNKNSIYDKEIAQRYIKSLYNYPVKLKLALPIFSWGIQIRDGKVVNLCNKFNPDEIVNDTNYVHLSKNIWQVKHANIKDGYYFKKDDKIKIENIPPVSLIEMADDLKQKFKNTPDEIIFYDLDDFNLKQYDKKIFQKVCDHF